MNERKSIVNRLYFIFKPAIYLMNHIKFSKKFSLIFFIFLIPLAVSLSYMFIKMNTSIDIKEKHSIGIQYNIAVRSLIQHTQEHRGLSSTYLNGSPDFKEKVKAKEKDLEKDMAAIESIDKKNGELLKTTTVWNSLKEELIALEGVLDNLTPKESFDKHTALIKKMLVFTETVADHSELILQEQTDRYYLVEVVTINIPRIAEYMGQSRALGSGAASKKSITKEEKNKLQSIVQSIEMLLQDTDKGMQLVFERNPDAASATKASYTKAVAASNTLMDTVKKKLIDSDTIDLNPQEYFDFATSAINDVYAMLTSVSLSLDTSAKNEMATIIMQKQIMSFLTIVVCLLIVYLFTAFYLGIMDTVSSIKNAAAKIAEGDLSQRLTLGVKDETKSIIDSLNHVAEAFSLMVTGSKILAENAHVASDTLSQIAEHTTEETQKMALSISEVAEGSKEQLSSTLDVSAAMNQVAEGVQEIAGSSTEVAYSSKLMEEESEKGNLSLKELINKMNDIRSYVEESSSSIDSLRKHSENIGQIIKTLEAISSQTNLLALNATIEAARAGEHGRGFSVVANEVKKLAEQSKDYTAEITNLITTMQQDTLQSVDRMSQISVGVKEGVEKVKVTESIFEKILGATKNVATQIQEVSAASEEISASAEEISATLSEVSSIAESNTETLQHVADGSQEQLAAIEEISASTSSLTVKTKELETLISKYKIMKI